LLLLPPYSPFLNPIENLFSHWKENIRQGTPQTTEQLLSLINMPVFLITRQNCRNYYTRMIGFLLQAQNSEIILDGSLNSYKFNIFLFFIFFRISYWLTNQKSMSH
ncbi:putative transposable element, partial [Pseudoloma neurophilia]